MSLGGRAGPGGQAGRGAGHGVGRGEVTAGRRRRGVARARRDRSRILCAPSLGEIIVCLGEYPA